MGALCRGMALAAEERYGIKSLDTLQMRALLKTVQKGMEQHKQYHIQYAIKLDSRGENISERQLKYIEYAAKFKAHYEAREVLVHALARQGGSLPARRELQKLEDRSEKSSALIRNCMMGDRPSSRGKFKNLSPSLMIEIFLCNS